MCYCRCLKRALIKKLFLTPEQGAVPVVKAVSMIFCICIHETSCYKKCFSRHARQPILIMAMASRSTSNLMLCPVSGPVHGVQQLYAVGPTIQQIGQVLGNEQVIDCSENANASWQLRCNTGHLRLQRKVQQPLLPALSTFPAIPLTGCGRSVLTSVNSAITREGWWRWRVCGGGGVGGGHCEKASCNELIPFVRGVAGKQ